MSDYCENCLLLVVVVVEVLLSSPLLLYVPFKDQWLSLLKKRGCIAFEEALLFFLCCSTKWVPLFHSPFHDLTVYAFANC